MAVHDEVIEAQVQEEIGSTTELSIPCNCKRELISGWLHGWHCVDFKIYANCHQHGTTGGVGEVWHRGSQTRDSSPYTLHARLGAAFCSILVKYHVRSGNDAVSKVGTKHAALSCNPLSLTNFAETDSLTTVDIKY